MAEQLSAESEASENLQGRYETIEQRRRRILVYLGNGVAGGFLFGFGVSAVLAGREVMAWFTLSHALIAFTNILIFKYTRNYLWANLGFSYGILALFTYLVASGGVDHTGPLWSYPMVAASIVLLGTRRGLTLIALMFLVAIALFYLPLPLPEVAAYTPNFKIRFLATFAALTFFTALHEYARARNQTELIRVSTRLDQLSRTDALTGLPNRRYMIDRLESENSRFRRHLRPFSIVFGDVDNFKAINDDFGHQTGDAVLQAIAGAIRSCLRQHDEVSRWGGEEFLVLLPESGKPIAVEVAEKLRAAVEQLVFEVEGRRLPLTMSFGVHTVDCVDRIDTFIHHADQKLYLAKEAGKNRVVAESLQAA